MIELRIKAEEKQLQQLTVYLCGGINGLSDSECKQWREIAKEGLHTATLDPMRRDYRGKEDESVNAIVEGDLDDIRHSHIMLVNASRPSWGTAMEIVYAHQYGKVIVAFVGHSATTSPTGTTWAPFSVSPWLRFHCGTIVNTVEEAIAAINDYASRHAKLHRS